jgi:hypothetical protein
LMIDVVEQVIERHPKVKNEGIPEGPDFRSQKKYRLPRNQLKKIPRPSFAACLTMPASLSGRTAKSINGRTQQCL